MIFDFRKGYDVVVAGAGIAGIAAALASARRGHRTALIEKHKPEAMSVEKVFYNNNAKTVIDVSQARGVIMLAAQKCRVPVFEYTPLQVKQSVVGYGRAEKMQIQEMTKRILNLESVPKPDDTADALAMAICHGHSSGSLMAAGAPGMPQLKIRKGI